MLCEALAIILIAGDGGASLYSSCRPSYEECRAYLQSYGIEGMDVLSDAPKLEIRTWKGNDPTDHISVGQCLRVGQLVREGAD